MPLPKTMDSAKRVPNLRLLAVHADIQMHVNSHIVGRALKKAKDWLGSSQSMKPDDLESCSDFSEIWRVLCKEDRIRVGDYEFLKQLCNKIDEKSIVTEIDGKLELKSSVDPVKCIHHADLQFAMNSCIDSELLKSVKDWLLTSKILTPECIDSCADFSDVWSRLFKLTRIRVGDYGFLKKLCNKIIRLKDLIPTIEKYERKIDAANAGNAESEDSSPIGTPTPEFWVPSGVMEYKDNNAVQGAEPMDIENGQSFELPDMPEERTADKILRYLTSSPVTQTLKRTHSLPDLHNQSAKARDAIRAKDDVSPTVKQRPAFRRMVTSLERSQGEHTSIENCSTFYDHGDTLQLLDHPEFVAAPANLLKQSPSLADFVQKKLDETNSRHSDGGSVKSEPAYQKSNFQARRRTGSSFSLYPVPNLPIIHSSSLTADDSEVDWIDIIDDEQDEEKERVLNYLNESLQPNLPLKMVNQHLTHAAIYVQIARLASSQKPSLLKSDLRNCLGELYRLNNLWVCMIGDSYHSAAYIAEGFVNISFNISNDSTHLAEHDEQDLEKHMSLINRSVEETFGVTLKIEDEVERMQNDVDASLTEDRNVLQELASMVLGKVNPVLYECRKTLFELVMAAEKWHKIDRETILLCLDQENANKTEQMKDYKGKMAENKIRWLALRDYCSSCRQKQEETRQLIQSLYKDEPLPRTAEKRAWRLAKKMALMTT